MSNRISDLNLFFSTPVWTSIVPDYQQINEKMYTYIKSLQNSDPKGMNKSNILGWHSHPFVLDAEEPKFFINSILPAINESMRDMSWDSEKNKMEITGMWTIINTKSARNERHIHSNNFISAAYYVKAPENAGDILFHDPREVNVIRKPNTKQANKLNAQIFNIKPKEGLLVLFPSYLHHSVNENLSDQERVVISFNIDIKF